MTKAKTMWHSITQRLTVCISKPTVALTLCALTLALLAQPVWRALAAGGDLDTSFSSDGKIDSLTGIDSGGYKRMAIQPDGKILVLNRFYGSNGQSTDFKLVRLKLNGSLDTTFDGDGIAVTNISGVDKTADLKIQPDGRIVVVGSCDVTGTPKLAIVRYLPNGSLDTSFAVNGKLIGPSFSRARSVALQSNGKIVVVGGYGSAGNELAMITRYNSNGSLDYGFNSGSGSPLPGGYVLADLNDNRFEAIAIQADGKILAANGVALRRYTSSGQIDSNFGVAGTVAITATNLSALLVQQNGKILTLTGIGPLLLSRYDMSGNLDFTFGVGGSSTIPLAGFPNGLAIQEDGRLIVGGGYDTTGAVLTRLGTNGLLDYSFGVGGYAVCNTFTPYEPGVTGGFFHAVSLQADGRIVAAGAEGNFTLEHTRLARYKNDNTDTQTTDVALGPITISPAFVYPGNIVTYTIPIKNNSATKATHVTLTSSVPSNTSFVGINLYPDWVAYAKPSPGGMGTISASTYQLTANTTTTVQIRVAVSTLAYSGQSISLMTSVNNTIADTVQNNIVIKAFTVQ